MDTIPICLCADVWPEQGHHPECPVRHEIEQLRAEVEALREKLAEGEAGIRRRLLGNTRAVPTFLVDGTLPRALEELLRRIEKCGASLDLTAASSLCADLVRATKGDIYAVCHIDTVLAAAGRE